MKLKKILGLGLSAALALSLFACSGGNAASSEPPADDTPSASEPAGNTDSTPTPEGNEPSGEVINVGFAQVGHESDWRTASTKSAQDVFSEANGYALSFVDCDNDPAAQLDAVRSFIQQGMDYIIIDPIQATGWDTVLTECDEAGGQEVMESYCQSYAGQFNVVICQNDNEAAGAMTAMDQAGIKYGVGGDVILVSFDANRPYVQMVCDGKINANFECNPMAAPTVDEIIKALEKGETPETEVYVSEQWFAAEDNVKTITVNGQEQEVIHVTQDVVDARPY